ncbi:hypothetical protein D1013_14070 [Euzebyella marina]|uniref:Uncharacterized protein n=1 Tax=Euzebyella marina TaxID=1761453 RepID=A0A3G2L823_9FLAO|nr:hypothetical protein [Euzebyella marina]AYN68428.1 hypothetical protein D1013_14070 [Euzebyella marina]
MKEQLVKYVALAIAVCYLANPMHEHITEFFHDTTHFFESPETIINHHSFDKSHSHGVHEHVGHNNSHEHNLIGLLNSIFESSDEDQGHNHDSIMTFLKYDKHITASIDFLSFTLILITPPVFKSNSDKIKKGFLPKIFEPPKVS